MIEENNDILKDTEDQQSELNNMVDEPIINSKSSLEEAEVSDEFDWKNFENQQRKCENRQKSENAGNFENWQTKMKIIKKS